MADVPSQSTSPPIQSKDDDEQQSSSLGMLHARRRIYCGNIVKLMGYSAIDRDTGNSLRLYRDRR